MTRSFKGVLAEELSAKNLRLSYPFPQAFSESPWLPPSLFIIYRLVLTACSVLLLVESIFKVQDYTWLLFFPNITAMLTAAYFMFGTVLCIHRAIKDRQESKNRKSSIDESDDDILPVSPRDGDFSPSPRNSYAEEPSLEQSACHPSDLESDGLSWPHKFYWMTFNITGSAMVAGTLLYFIYNEGRLDELDIAMFVSLSVFMLADTLLSFVPVKLLHSVYALIFTVLYALVVAIFLGVANEEVDQHILWFFSSLRTKTQAILTCVVFVAQPLFHAIYFGLHKLRWWLIALIYSREEGI